MVYGLMVRRTHPTLAGFDLQPSVPYAWQPIGTTIEVPSEKSQRLNVLGFYRIIF